MAQLQGDALRRPATVGTGTPRRWRTFRGALAATLLALVVPAAAAALPPRPPSAAKTRAAIGLLRVAPALSMSGYSRARFPHWRSQGNGCTTREVVLVRDGEGVETDDECNIVAGTWTSFYDGLTLTRGTQLDIDHVVPLANAWRSGAKRWDQDRRRDFANDLENSQLIAVSATSNRSKGDKGPEEWKPPRRGAWCLYSRWWVQVKRHWRLTVVRAERTELRQMVATC
ncbi:MAG TPA: HNH endonuclease family protein [Solirubrobacteraceae bacterium]|jgi:hypothetical protein